MNTKCRQFYWGGMVLLETDMQTCDVPDPDPAQHMIEVGSDWFVRARVRVVPSGIYTTPIVRVLFEQANWLTNNGD